MTTLEEARARYKDHVSQFEEKEVRRMVYLGDGKGFATSNLNVSANPSYVYARDRLGESEHFFPVKLNRSVRPAFNLPVWVGKRASDAYERILDVVEQFAEYSNSASSISGLAPHNKQHEFGGGDDHFIDTPLIKEGLLRPRNPSSSVVDVLGFYYAKESGWDYFSGSSISHMLSFAPTSGSVYVTVSFDPEAQVLKYITGASFSLGDSSYEGLIENIGASSLVSSFQYIPAPSKDSIPLGAVLLDNSTTVLIGANMEE